MEFMKLGMVGLGFVAGIAFVVACPSPQDVMPGLGSSGGGGSSTSGFFATSSGSGRGSTTGGLFSTSTASAAEPDPCLQWEIMWRGTGNNWGSNTPKAMPEGWQPYHVDQFGDIHLRRCAD